MSGEKPAENAYPIHELIKRRWSPRAFAERPVEHDKLRSLFEAARWAPSALNAQPWGFILATKEAKEGSIAYLGASLKGTSNGHAVPLFLF